MKLNRKFVQAALIGGASSIAMATAAMAAEEAEFKIAAGELRNALTTYIDQSGEQLIYRVDDVRGAQTKGVSGRHESDDALEILLDDTGFRAQWDRSGAAVVVKTGLLNNASQEVSSFRLAQADTGVSQIVEIDDRDAGDEEKARDEIIVTGTNIRGIEDGPSPVLVFDKKAIEMTGAASLQQFFATIPQNFGGGANPGNTLFSNNVGRDSLTTGFGAGINIRGLGSGTTLTLINGKRISNSDSGSFVDISLIPISAVERIEVLTDGASAIYGADAVGGVVNIILRSDFDGAELSGRYAATTQSGYSEYKVGTAVGTSWASGNGLVTFEAFSNENLLATEREFSKNAPALPYDLTPASDRYSVYSTIRQDVTNSIVLSVDGFYSNRNTDFVSSAFGFSGQILGTRDVSVNQFGGNLGFDVSLPEKWELGLDVSVSGSTIEVESNTSEVGVMTQTFSGNKTDAWFVQSILDGPLFSTFGGSARGAVGVSFRNEQFKTTNGLADSQTVELESDRQNFAAFGEFYLPLIGSDNNFPTVERLEVTAAVRFDDYSDFGSSTNPKVGALWEIVPGFVLHGTYGTSFRAPLFNDLSDRNSIAILASLPNAASSSGRTNTIVALGGNPNLGPEEASTWTAGFKWETEKLDGFRASASYYDIKYDNRIDRATNNIPAIFVNADVLAPILTKNPTAAEIDELVNIGGNGFQIFRVGPFALPAALGASDTEVIADLRLNNIAVTNQNGIDFDLTYERDTRIGSLNFGIVGNYIIESSRQVTVTSSSFSVVGTIFNPVDLTLRGRLGWQKDAWTSALFVNYANNYLDNSATVDVPIEDWTTVDFTLRYDTDVKSSVLSGVSIIFSAQNLFNADPPLVSNIRGTGFDPTNANPLGRLLAIDITARW